MSLYLYSLFPDDSFTGKNDGPTEPDLVPEEPLFEIVSYLTLHEWPEVTEGSNQSKEGSDQDKITVDDVKNSKKRRNLWFIFQRSLVWLTAFKY